MNLIKTFYFLSFLALVSCDDTFLPETINDSVFISYNENGEKVQKSVSDVNDEFKRKYLK